MIGVSPADEVVAGLGKSREWSAGTVRTFLARLVKKKVVAAQKDESRKLIDRLFNGRIAPFVTPFSERQDLSRDELA